MPPRKVSKKIKKAKNSTKTVKRVFEETIEILDSDDDFKIPNPSVRGIKKDVKLRKSLNAIEVENFENVVDVKVVKKTLPITAANIIQIDVEDGLNCSTDDQCSRSTLNDIPACTYNCTANDTDSKDVWKGLMQRMQQNQKVAFTSSSSSFVKNSRSKAGTKKPVVTFPKKSNRPLVINATANGNRNGLNCTIPEISLKSSGSPPKKIKLEMDKDQHASTSSSEILSESKNTGILYPDTKIPAMFLKPEEKAALAVAEKLKRTNISSNPNLILSVLSEPQTFSSVNETADKFDGKIVKINDYTSDVDPYAGQKKKVCPFYKKLPGTKFSVDAFNYGLIDGIDWYFLSHFHSDHYIGLTKKFCKTIICSPPTANLVKMKLYVEDKCIRQLQLNTPYIVDGVEIVLVDANHCPGSVMFIFRLPNGITYLHTGDFRFTTDMLDNHYLKGLKIDNLYLDTTYCEPKYDFPTQMESIVALISAVKRKLKYRPKTLIICGTYVIGKERVYFSLAEALNLKVFANTEKRRIINALENPRFSSYLTDSEDAGNIHVAQMFSIVPKFLSEYLATRSSKYTNIIGIKPSGWQFSFAGSGTSIKSYFNDTVTIIGVPYSEHSSFSELQEFVCKTKPRKVQPTVNVGSEAKRTAMMNHINEWMQS